MKKLEWHTEQRIINNLIPYKENPRTMTEKQKNDLEESLKRFNLMSIPVINTDNTIISGHQRMKILQLLGRGDEEIDVRVPNRKLTDKELKEANLRENKNLGGWDWDMLANEDEELLLDVGFTEEELENPTFETTEDMEKEEEIREYRRVHILISIEVDSYDEINKELEIIKNKITGKGEYEQTAN
jgi:hypothetical protein